MIGTNSTIETEYDEKTYKRSSDKPRVMIAKKAPENSKESRK